MDGLDTALSVARLSLAASGLGLLSSTIAVPFALDLQAWSIVCGLLLEAGGKFIGRKLQAEKHNQICVLAKSKLNSIADRISTAVSADTISYGEFRLILSIR